MITTRIPLTVNITVQRLDINVVLGILSKDLPIILNLLQLFYNVSIFD